MREFSRGKAAWTVARSTLVWAMSTGVSMGGVGPYVEDFPVDAANWRDASGVTGLDWSATGGPDGGASASTVFNFAALAENDTPVLFRGQAAFGSSGGAFVGDWVTGGIDGFDVMVRHDAGVPLIYFARFAGPANFPGANKIFVIPVPSDTWTPLSTALPDASLIFEGPFSYEDVFGNIGNVQIGVSVPASLAGIDQDIHFGVDKISIVPEPAALALLAGGGLAVLGKRRVRRDMRS